MGRKMSDLFEKHRRTLEKLPQIELDAYAEAVRQFSDRNRKAVAVAHVLQDMASKGVSVEDLLSADIAPKAPRYRDPKTGETWSGIGRRPKWMQGKEKEDFLETGPVDVEAGEEA